MSASALSSILRKNEARPLRGGCACLQPIGETLEAACRKPAQQARHVAKMVVRSFALTVAAVTRRLYIPIALAFGFEFGSAYRTIA